MYPPRTARKNCGGLCKAWTCQGTFHKVGGINHEDVKLYHYYKNVSANETAPGPIQRDPGGQRKESEQTKRILILQNISNSDIPLGNITNGMDHLNCECHHCYETLHHIGLMLRKLSIIKKHEICGICDNCKNNYNEKFYNNCMYCNEVIKSFMNILRGEKECCRLKQWMRKIRHLPCAMHKGLKHRGSSKSARTLNVGELFADDFNKIQRARSANEIEAKEGMDDDENFKKSGKYNSAIDTNLASQRNKSVEYILKTDEYLTRKAKIKEKEKTSTHTKKGNKSDSVLRVKDSKSKHFVTRGQKDGDGEAAKSKYSKTMGQKDGYSDSKRKEQNESQKKNRGKNKTDGTLKGKIKTDVFDEFEFRNMKDAQMKEKIKDGKEVKTKGIDEKALEQRKKTPDETVVDIRTKPEIKATASQMLLFQARAKEQRDGAGFGKHGEKSTMSKYNEDIAKRLALDSLPRLGKILITDDDLSLRASTSELIPPKITRTHEQCFASFDRLSIRLKTQVENITDAQKYHTEKAIVGERIRKFHHNVLSKSDRDIKPLLFERKEDDTMAAGDSNVNEDMANKKVTDISNNAAQIESGQPKGVIRYKLSDRQFIDKGWTVLPTEKIVQKMNVYRMRPSRPEYDWFTRNKKRCPMVYDTGEKLADVDESGNGRWFYRNGLVALDYYSTKDMNAQQRFIVYSPGRFDGQFLQKFIPPTVLACFDWLGNGVVYDHGGNIRLKYNHTEGILMDKTLAPVTHWKWHALNDPPVLQQIMIDTQLHQKDKKILEYAKGDSNTQNVYAADDEHMLAIEYEHFASEKRKKLSHKFKPYQIKSKVIKINEQFSLRVLDQASVYLSFRDGKNIFKLNLGMSLDSREIVDTETTEVGEVTSSYDRPARTGSLAKIQEIVNNAKKQEKYRTDRERRIKWPERQLSVDKFKDVIYVPPPIK